MQVTRSVLARRVFEDKVLRTHGVCCMLAYADVCIQLVLTYADVCIQLVRALAACLECPLAWVQVEDVHAGSLYTYIRRSCLECPLAIYTYIYIYM